MGGVVVSMSVADSRSNSLFLGTDLKLADYYLGADLYIGKSGDMDVISEEMNIAQAILHRLRTIKGELAELGHPDYGSTILDFIGQPNNSVTRSRLRLAIRDAIRQEHRVKQIVSIDVKQRLPDNINNNIRASGTKEDEGDLEKQSVKTMRSGFSPVGGGGATAAAAAEGAHLYDTGGGGGSKKYDGTKYDALINPTEILNSVDVDIVIIPIGLETPIQIAFPFNLESATPIQIARPLSSEVS
jgi:phage baseplate assembly protein W